MELLLIPLMLITGAALLHLGVNGAPSIGKPVAAVASAVSLKSMRLSAPLRPDRIPDGGSSYSHAREDVALELSDVLLADLLTEMMQFRKDLDALRIQVDAMASGPAKRSASARKRTTSAA
jgi:hypothetical protein